MMTKSVTISHLLRVVSKCEVRDVNRSGGAEDLAPVVNGFGIRVRVVEPLGSHLLLTGSAEDHKLRVVVPPDTAVRAGDTVALRPDLAHVAWMHPETGDALEPS